MKIAKYATTILTFFLAITACTIYKPTQQKNSSSLQIGYLDNRPTKPARELALGNSIIDVDTTGIREGRYLSDEELQKVKAASYRFYTHVKVIDGFYETDIKDPNSINLTSQVFYLYLNDMIKANESILKMHKEGKKIEVDPIDYKALADLLQ